MPHKILTALVAILASLSACSSNSIESSRLGREMRNSKSQGAASILGDAVFAMTKGHDPASAAEILKSDGATCAGLTCTWRFDDKESISDTWGVRPSGPLKTWTTAYKVTFSGKSIIASRSDIIPVVTSHEVN